MKKIITLLLAAGAFISVNAQTTKEDARKVVLGGEKSKGGGTTTTKGGRDVILGGGNGTEVDGYPNGTTRQAQVDQVNREYNAKINSIRNNPTLTQSEKETMIRQLEKERARKIKQINRAYEGGKDGDRYEKKKGNNGKHLGWEKGKGNPHKNGGKVKNKKD